MTHHATQISPRPDDDAMQRVRAMVVEHFVGMDEDPRDTTAEQLIDDLSEALHWDALDADTHVDIGLSADETLIHQALAEYSMAKTAMEDGAEDPDGRIAMYRDLEAVAAKRFLVR